MSLHIADGSKPKAHDVLSASVIQAPLAQALSELGRGDARRTARAVHTLRALAEAARLQELGALALEAEKALEGLGDVGRALTLLARHGTALLAPRTRLDPATTWSGSVALFCAATKAYSESVGKVAQLEVHASAVVYGQDLSLLAGLLLHLMRNAVAHGIERSVERVVRQKPATGRLELTLDVVNNVLFGRFVDDGGGIDVQAVTKKAESQGLWKGPHAPSTNADLLSLITAPSFSTASTAEVLFGRGVGLEAVRATLVEAEGDLRLERTNTSGTAFTFSWVLREALQMPLSEGTAA